MVECSNVERWTERWVDGWITVCGLCQLIALETNRYALQMGVSGWHDVTG